MMKTEFVPRVNQLDALQLDNDIIRIVHNQVVNAAHNISPWLLGQCSPEIDLIIRAAVWNYSVRLNSATFGQRLLFITYDRDQLLTNFNIYKHFFLNVLLKYIRDNIAYRLTAKQSIQTCVSYCEIFITFCSMLNFFRFLHVGKRPSLVDYVLGLDNISLYGNRRREIGYSNMTRELIWGGFMELLGFTLPLINYHYVKRKCRQTFNALISSKSHELSEHEKPVFNVNTKCAYCDERPTLPYHMGCSHVFCYYCLKGNLLADEQFECSICLQKSKFTKQL